MDHLRVKILKMKCLLATIECIVRGVFMPFFLYDTGIFVSSDFLVFSIFSLAKNCSLH